VIQEVQRIYRPDESVTFEFSKDGRFFSEAFLITMPYQRKIGRYRLTENTLRFMEDADENGPEKQWEVTIVSITETDLEMSVKEGNAVCKRIMEK
jgi:hypothetical protein